MKETSKLLIFIIVVFLCGSGSGAVAASFYFGHRLVQIQEARKKSDGAECQSFIDSKNATIADLTRQLDETTVLNDVFVKEFSEDTVLYDASANIPTSTIDAPGTFSRLAVGLAQGYQALHAKAGARWLIHAKITPIAIGGNREIGCEYHNRDGSLDPEACSPIVKLPDGAQ